jgi:hypothetical protein
VEKIKAKLTEAAEVYRKDKEVSQVLTGFSLDELGGGELAHADLQTLDWHVMQDPKVR